jgi:hypothetical protein
LVGISVVRGCRRAKYEENLGLVLSVNCWWLLVEVGWCASHQVIIHGRMVEVDLGQSVSRASLLGLPVIG